VLFDAKLDHVLLIQRGAEPAKGLWSFPGGLVQVGETVRQACEREVLEETGLAVSLDEVATVVERIVSDDHGRVQYHYLIVDLWGYAPGEQPQARSDAAAVQWCPLTDLSRLATTRGVPEAVHRALLLARGETPTGAFFPQD